jgi:hypothetical protein
MKICIPTANEAAPRAGTAKSAARIRPGKPFGAWGLALFIATSCTAKTSSDSPVEAEKSAAFDPTAVATQLAQNLKQPIDLEDPSTCATCHAAVYAEWIESMHARAHQTKDPIFGAMRDFRLSLGQKIEGKCENCHSPRARGDFASAAALAGVSCAACHNIEAVHAAEYAKGAKLIEIAKDDTMRSARDVTDGSSPVHGNGPALAALADGKTLCLACHGKHDNPAKVPVCTTGSELEAYAGEETCVSCHMPLEDGASGAVSNRSQHRSHRFVGPHRAYLQGDPSLLASGVDLKVTRSDTHVRVEIRNRSGHAFPSGFPARVAWVEVVGLDAKGDVIWRNFSADPMKESPESVFNKVYVDAEGQPTMPPLSVELARDNRLKPDETRVLEFPLPSSVASVRASVIYRLLPVSAAQRLGLGESELAKPVRVRSARTDDG